MSLQFPFNWYEEKPCEICDGTGFISIDPWAERPSFIHNDYELDRVECPHCEGKGKLQIRIT